MFDKAYTSATMDYELIFWGYTFAIKKITWFAQVEKEIRQRNKTHTHMSCFNKGMARQVKANVFLGN